MHGLTRTTFQRSRSYPREPRSLARPMSARSVLDVPLRFPPVVCRLSELSRYGLLAPVSHLIVCPPRRTFTAPALSGAFLPANPTRELGGRLRISKHLVMSVRPATAVPLSIGLAATPPLAVDESFFVVHRP